VIVVFLGPSLPRSEAEAVLRGADYRPPAARGDLRRAADDHAIAIGLIDGVFYQRAAVAHREILYAIGKGIPVVGGSSMGALRASELDSYGMIGAGEIYRWYKEGKIRSDDEVALAFHPETYCALSEPLVNIRATLDALRDKGLTSTEGDAILNAAKEVPFHLRSQQSIIQRAVSNGLDAGRAGVLLRMMKEGRVDQKRIDAVRVLERLRTFVG